MFTGPNCLHCDAMEKHLNKISKTLGLKIAKLDIWETPMNLKLFERCDEGRRCGGLPFFFNRKTGQCVCGATTFGNLREWAKGKPCNMHYYLPEEGPEDGEEGEEGNIALGEVKRGRNTGTGMMGRFFNSWDNAKALGKENMKRKMAEQQKKFKEASKPSEAGKAEAEAEAVA